MVRRAARRTAAAAITLWLVTVVVFALIHLAPGDPLAGAEESSRGLPPAARAALERLYRLDEPLHRQYLLWLGDVLRGDLGRSLHDRRPVAEKIGERIGTTLLLNALALVVAAAIAVPLGAGAALRPGARLDRWSAPLTYALYAVPVFWAALLLQIALSVRLDWLPLSGLVRDGHEALGPAARLLDRAAHLVLPVLCLSYGGVAFLSRFVRAALLDNAAPESYLAARARGLSGLAVLYRHGFRLASLPLLTLAGLVLPGLLSGSVIVESVFAIPGLGRLFVEAALQRDVPVLMGLTLLSGAATLAGMLGADALYAVLDPRLRRA